MIKRFFATSDSSVLFFQRVILGLVIFPHGAQKLFGWFGGFGWAGSIGTFSSMGIPPVIGALVILGESLGALGLIIGFATRLGALGVVGSMAGALLMVHLPYGFFMNWTGKNAGEGFEFHLLALALALPILVKGAGCCSVDRMIARALD